MCCRAGARRVRDWRLTSRIEAVALLLGSVDVAAWVRCIPSVSGSAFSDLRQKSFKGELKLTISEAAHSRNSVRGTSAPCSSDACIRARRAWRVAPARLRMAVPLRCDVFIGWSSGAAAFAQTGCLLAMESVRAEVAQFGS